MFIINYNRNKPILSVIQKEKDYQTNVIYNDRINEFIPTITFTVKNLGYLNSKYVEDYLKMSAIEIFENLQKDISNILLSLNYQTEIEKSYQDLTFCKNTAMSLEKVLNKEGMENMELPLNFKIFPKTFLIDLSNEATGGMNYTIDEIPLFFVKKEEQFFVILKNISKTEISLKDSKLEIELELFDSFKKFDDFSSPLFLYKVNKLKFNDEKLKGLFKNLNISLCYFNN